MNWAAISFDWNQIRAFLATAEAGSLSGAARALKQTQPTIGRQIAALEQELGVLLFERTSRSLTLTQTGRDLVGHVRDMAEAATRVSITASGGSTAVDGKVRITASDLFCAVLMPKVLQRLSDMAPRLQIDLVADNEIRDLMHREADIAIRHVRPTEPDLIAKYLRDETAHLYASTKYLERKGRPTSVEDLSAYDFIGFGDDARAVASLAPFGVNLREENFRYGSASGPVAWALVKHDLGIAAMSDQVGMDTPGVERLNIAMPPITFPIWLVTHRELHTSRRIRLVFDLLVEVMGEVPATSA